MLPTISTPGRGYGATLYWRPSQLWGSNKATGWPAALVRVTNLKLRFSRLRDKMLVFVGLVKKCLQHGHSFRLAGVWLKFKHLHFACAVNQFCSSRVLKKGIYPFQVSHENIHQFIHPFFFTFRRIRALCFTRQERYHTPHPCWP